MIRKQRGAPSPMFLPNHSIRIGTLVIPSQSNRVQPVGLVTPLPIKSHPALSGADDSPSMSNIVQPVRLAISLRVKYRPASGVDRGAIMSFLRMVMYWRRRSTERITYASEPFPSNQTGQIFQLVRTSYSADHTNTTPIHLVSNIICRNSNQRSKSFVELSIWYCFCVTIHIMYTAVIWEMFTAVLFDIDNTYVFCYIGYVRYCFVLQ